MTSTPIPAPRLTLAAIEHPETDLEIKRSHFLGRAARTNSQEEAREFIAQVRAVHPTARHHCSVFIIDNPNALPTERSSDDGEPSGTAGQPMLDVLRGSGLTNATVVVARYFGGTLLGTGGLVRAYSEATAMAIEAATKVRLATRFLWHVPAPMAQAGRLESDLRSQENTEIPGIPGGITVEDTRWEATRALLTLTTATPDPAGLSAWLAALTGGAVQPTPAGSRVIELPEPLTFQH